MKVQKLFQFMCKLVTTTVEHHHYRPASSACSWRSTSIHQPSSSSTHRSLSESDGCGRWRYAASSIASRTRWSLFSGWGPSGAPPYRGLRRIVVVDDGSGGCVARDNWFIVCCSLAESGRINDCSSRLLDMSTAPRSTQNIMSTEWSEAPLQPHYIFLLQHSCLLALYLWA